jgi:hypothetical protein
MAKRTDFMTRDSLTGVMRHHPYLQILLKEDWQDYLLLLSEIYDYLEDFSGRVPMDAARMLAIRFYSQSNLANVEQKVAAFFAMAIGELRVLQDSHDQFAQRYIETTRAGKDLLHLFEQLISQRNRFSGLGAEILLGVLNDILISRREMTVDEAIRHHKERIDAYRDDIVRIKKDGLSAAQLLPMAHSNEELFAQAESASAHVLQSMEEVKEAIERQRKDLASSYFTKQESAGQVLNATADFYDGLYASSSYLSYVQAKELLSHLEAFQARFALRNVDHLLNRIDREGLVDKESIKRSNLRYFMRHFERADVSIQEKIKAQIRILQQQVLYSISTDVQGLSVSLQGILSLLHINSNRALGFVEAEPLEIELRDDFDFGPAELSSFELPVEVAPQELTEHGFDLLQERELFLALVKAEEGTLRDILTRLRAVLAETPEIQMSDYIFASGLAEYYVLSEVSSFANDIEKVEKSGSSRVDLFIGSKYGEFVLKHSMDFILRRKVGPADGKIRH